MPALPPLKDIYSNPKLLDELTDEQFASVLKQLKSLLKGQGKPNLPTTPAEFAVQYSKGEWQTAKHLNYLSDKLMALEQRKIKRLLVSMPPRSGKSWLIDWYFPAWWLTRHPKDRIILAGYGEQFARQWGGRVRDLIIEYGDELNLTVNKQTTAADDWELSTRGGMLSVGVGGAIMGRGANLMILDDVIKSEEEANSETYREKMWDWWQTTAYTRLEPNAVVVACMTRWHTDDLFARIIAQDEEFKDWEVINIPAEALDNDVLGREVGQWLWDRYKPEEYEEKKRTMTPWWWSALYMGSPTPAGGGLLQRDWFRTYNTVPEDADQWIQSWDLSLKDKMENDYSVGQVWARKGANCYLVDQVRGHFSLHEVQTHFKNWTIKYPKAKAKLVEDTALGPALKQTLGHVVPGIIPINPKSTSKRSRVENAVPILQGGNIFVPVREDDGMDKWVTQFIEECSAFPKGVNDDQVDAFTQAIAFLQPAAWRQLKREADIEQNEAKILTPGDLRARQITDYFLHSRKRAAKRHGGRSLQRKLW